jgi:hypothetical protein
MPQTSLGISVALDLLCLYLKKTPPLTFAPLGTSTSIPYQSPFGTSLGFTVLMLDQVDPLVEYSKCNASELPSGGSPHVADVAAFTLKYNLLTEVNMTRSFVEIVLVAAVVLFG